MADEFEATATSGTAAEPVRRGRRALVLGAAAAVAAVGLDRRDAHAADGSPTVLGQLNTATASTRIVASAATYAFESESQASYGFGVAGRGTAYGVYGVANGYAGVFGDTSGTGSVGVSGLSRSTTGSGAGVSGGASSPNGTGVVGSSPGIGVHGYNSFSITRPAGSIGVCGQSNQSDGLGGYFAGPRAAVRLEPRPSAGAPTTGQHEIGDLVVDSVGRVYVCTAAGTPGTWNELGAPAPAVVAPAPRPTLHLLPTPERFIDTRDGTGGVRGPVPAGTTRTFSLTGADGLSRNPALRVPDTAVYVAGNLTVLGEEGAPLGSFITLWPSGVRPPTASINFGPARSLGAVNNSVLVNLADVPGGHRGFQIYNNAGCDYVFDATGYYLVA